MKLYTSIGMELYTSIGMGFYTSISVGLYTSIGISSSTRHIQYQCKVGMCLITVVTVVTM